MPMIRMKPISPVVRDVPGQACTSLPTCTLPRGPDIPARWDAALVEVEPVFLLGLRPLLDMDVHRRIGHDQAVRLDLDLA